MDIGIIILAIGISGIKFLVGTNKNLPSISDLVSGSATIFCLIVMAFLFIKSFCNLWFSLLWDAHILRNNLCLADRKGPEDKFQQKHCD